MDTTATQPIPNPISTPPHQATGVLKTVGRDFTYLVAVFAMSIVALVVWVTGLSVTLSLLVLIVGLFVWIGTAYVLRWTTAIDRALAGWLRGSPVRAVYRAPRDKGVLALLRAITTDPQTWKNFGWLVLNSIFGFAFSLAALSVTALVIGYIAMPLWWWAIPHPETQYGTLNLGIYTVTSTGWAFVTTAIGLALAPLALLLNHGVAKVHAAAAAEILGPTERQELRARVRELASTRSDVVTAADDQLKRIERDLHDGAQARLVALAMELGMAEEELARDPEAARATVRKARDEALGALGELRDLSRGLRPALLQERGLQTAIEDLAERSAVPASVNVIGDVEQVPDQVSTAAYFVVAEALTNVNKHSDATGAQITIERRDKDLTVTVLDNGRGGAKPDGSGLHGLRTRVRALDGRLEVHSPPGGPTVVRAELPCA
jgi:signal transduction histidine kinase